MRYRWMLVFLFTAVLWSVHIDRPVDLPGWHEFDYASIARNFVREGNNILYPRIDWRGDGPGFTEMEFPIIPWIIAQLYRVFGIHEVIGRLLSYAFMLLSLFVFSKIARKILPESAAIVATLFVVVSHEIVQVATAIQPEPLMLLLYLMAVYSFVEWYESRRWSSYGFAAASFAGAMLVKSPAAHLAIFFLLWSLYQDGAQAFRRPALYLFAMISFAPAIWWYAHASSLWHQFHNSMGVSNEDHWFGLDLLKRPKVILNLICVDLFLVCGGGGLLVACSALRKDSELALRWLVAVGIYLIVILRTSGAYWAAYYHVVAVPPVALLFGAGVYRARFSHRVFFWSAASVGLLLLCFLLSGRINVAHLPGVFQDLLLARSSPVVLLVMAVTGVAVTVLAWSIVGDRTQFKQGHPLVIVGCAAYFFISGQLLLGSWKSFETRSPQFDCKSRFQNKLPAGSLIVASGGPCADASGHRVANDAPNMFYWLDHKGFTTCQANDSIANLNTAIYRGAKYFVADKESLKLQPAFEGELRNAFPLVGACETALLFELRPMNEKY